MKSGPNKIGTVLAAAAMLLGLGAAQAGASKLPAPPSDTAVNTHQSSETVHLIEGRSMVLNTEVPLKRVYIGNPLVLLSYTAGANEIVLTAKATGTSSLMVWDVNGGSKLYTVEVGMDPAAVQDALKVEYPTEPITATVTGDHIVLSGNVTTKEVADGAEKLADNYTKLVVSSLQVTGHPREVRLKVRIAEVDRSKLVQFGVNLLSGGKQVATTSTTQFPGSSITGIGAAGPTQGSLTTVGILNPLNYFYYNVAHGIGASIQDLAQHNVLQILAEPTLSAMSGQPASFLSGGEFPYPTIQSSAGSTPVVTISFRPYGIKVDFTPYVSADGMIRLKVAPEVSSLDYANAVQISGYTIPAISTRRAETQVELRSGQTFMIGGLLDHQTTEQFAHTPGISSVPILGELFKSKNNNHSVTELMVFVTAELVDPNAEPVPAEPKPSVPSMHRDNFDKQLHKMRGIDPNTNGDTGKAVTPVAPQNQAAPDTTPVTATATPDVAPSAPAPVAEAPVVAAAPVVTTPEPAPMPAPVVAEAPIAPEPTPAPVVTTPAPTPAPAPVVAEAPIAPAPTPAPAVTTPEPAPMPAPVVAETPATPEPAPMPAPVVAETPATPEPTPAPVTPEPAPMPAPVVAETPATPEPTPAPVTPEPAPMPAPVVAETPAVPEPTPAPAALAAPDATAAATDSGVPPLLAAPDAPEDAPATSTAAPAPTPAASVMPAPANTSAVPAQTPAPTATPATDDDETPVIARMQVPATSAAPEVAALQPPAAMTAGPAATQNVAQAQATAPKMRLRMKIATN